MYQIFPDRFANRPSAPAWAKAAAWDDPVIGEGPDTPRQVCGGDLDGITERLDHIASLGVASLLGDPQLVDVAFGMLCAYPGVPMIYAGDEIGLAAMGPEYARIPMPWAHPERWDGRRLALTRALFGARAQSAALRRGGLRWLHIGDDALTFVREAPGERVLVHAARAAHAPVRLPVSVVGAELAGLAGSANLQASADGTVALPAEGPAFGMWELAEG